MLLAVAAVAVAVFGSGLATSSAEPADRATTKTVFMRFNGQQLKFFAPDTIKSGANLRVVNKTSPRVIGPHTFSLVERSELPKTRPARRGASPRATSAATSPAGTDPTATRHRPSIPPRPARPAGTGWGRRPRTRAIPGSSAAGTAPSPRRSPPPVRRGCTSSARSIRSCRGRSRSTRSWCPEPTGLTPGARAAEAVRAPAFFGGLGGAVLALLLPVRLRPGGFLPVSEDTSLAAAATPFRRRLPIPRVLRRDTSGSRSARPRSRSFPGRRRGCGHTAAASRARRSGAAPGSRPRSPSFTGSAARRAS